MRQWGPIRCLAVFSSDTPDIYTVSENLPKATCQTIARLSICFNYKEYLLISTGIIRFMTNSLSSNSSQAVSTPVVDTDHPQVRQVVVDADQAGQRIDNFLVTLLKGVPKSHIYRILRKGEVRVNKGRVKAEYKLKGGDQVRVPPVRVAQTPEVERASQSLTDHLSKAILYEDKSLLIINKPSGLAVHGGSGVSLGLIEALRQIRPQDKFLELVHRLDRETSGCIMVAKKRSMLKYLQDLLRQGKGANITKTYIALVKGQWPQNKLRIDLALSKRELPDGNRVVRVDADGKPSLTVFKVLREFPLCTLMEASPITGRTHQIRVHAQAVGCPLVGDDKYGDDEFNRKMRKTGISRLYLHAARLEVRLPDMPDMLCVEAPLEHALVQATNRCGS